MKRLAVLVSVLSLAGCATRIPQELRQPNISRATVSAARAHAVPSGTRVRWGGTIAKVSNTPRATWIQVISHPLRHDGRPRRGHGGGRFLARVPGFLDPAVYAVGRKFTVVGTFSGFERDPIGNYLYNFPVVRTIATHLWRPRPRPYYGYSAWPWGWGWGWGGFGPDPDWGWHEDDDGFGP